METPSNNTITSAEGFKAAAAACGLKQSGNLDLALVYSERNCTAAGVFTQNQVVAAPVTVDRETLATNATRIRAVVANAGNANACTGDPGLADARQMQWLAAHHLNCAPEQVLVLSTGVIGVPLPMARVQAGIETAAIHLAGSAESGHQVAQAIMTTDTRPKYLAVRVNLPAGAVTLGGMAKGAGMIHPNMATMLAVLTTDAAVEAGLLQQLLQTAVDQSFNRISVDGDTSTNDSVLLLANGASGVSVDEESLEQFGRVLTHVCIELAKKVVRDGEGATRFVEIHVTGARNEAEAHRIAETIATSPLVKTAFAGGDPNWGRIVAAAGRAGVAFDQRQVNLWIGPAGNGRRLQLLAQGAPAAYTESEAAALFAEPEFVVRLDLGQGDATSLMWTTDLTHDYVSINAAYRT